MEAGSTKDVATLLIPTRGLAFIRRIETEETYPSSNIIVTPKSRDQVTKCQFEVVRLGNYARCEDEDCTRPHTKAQEHKHNLQIGDWVLCKNRSWMLTDDPHIYVIRTDDILGKFD